ncbi:MAG: response regulator transcription factor [Acidimicrobiales bacterium]
MASDGVPADQSIRRTVVVADDDPGVREALADLLSGDDRLEVVAVAGDGIEAVATCLEHRPDVLVLDVHMPQGGGEHAARELTRLQPGLVIIAFSANVDRVTRRTMLEAGAAAVVAKDAIAGLVELVAGEAT